MKKFSFPLERARHWRESQVRLEETCLERLFAERTLLELRRDALEREAAQSNTTLTLGTAVYQADLQAIDAFRRYVAAERRKIAAGFHHLGQRITAQRARVVEARRKFELLDKLRGRKWKAWDAGVAREIETEAGEIFLARWTGSGDDGNP